MELIRKLGLLEVLIRIANSDITGDDIVAWAKHAVDLGVESANLYVLMAFPKSSHREDVRELFEKVLKDVGVEVPVKSMLFAAYFEDKLSELLDDDGSKQELILDSIHRQIISPLCHPKELQVWCELWEGLNLEGLPLRPGEQRDPRELAREFKSKLPLKIFEDVDRLHNPYPQ